MLAGGILIAAVGIGFVRYGWARRRAIAVGGWMLVGVAMPLLARDSGAWGISVGAAAASVAALALVAFAGVAAPAPARIAGTRRDPPRLARPPVWPGMGRRVLVFVATVPVAFLAAQGLAYGAHGAALRAGWVPADAIVLAMMLQPIAWALIVTAQLTRESVRRMWTAPALAAATGLLLWGLA
ncbi:MAG: hypothetical protein PGN09_06505 [Sphingomonas fennica]